MKQVEAHQWAVQFQATTLMIFIDCGIVEALVVIVKTGHPSSGDLAFTLLADILTICAKRLPPSYNDNVQVIYYTYLGFTSVICPGFRLSERAHKAIYKGETCQNI